MLEHQTDEDLIQAYRAQSIDWAQLFKVLVPRHQPRLFQYLWRKTGSSHDAEDLIQETFIRAYQKIDLYDVQYSFKTWLYTIATRLTINHQTKASPILNDELSEALEAKEEQLPNFEALWEKAKNLPQDQYTVLLLKYAEELNIKEISEIIEKPINTVKVILHRARKNLSQHVNFDDIYVH